MTVELAQWEASITDLWARFDSLDRESGVAAMRELAAECPTTDGRAAFELAGMYDSLGFEAEAGAEYERALELGLDDARHAQLAVQYGSTLRNLGRLEEAIRLLQDAPTHASTGSAPRVVLALALHGAGRKDEALRVAIEAQIDALPRYQRSMRNYAAALTGATGEATGAGETTTPREDRMTISYRSDRTLKQDDLTALYASVGWSAYTKDPARLEAAVAASLAVVTAWAGGQLIGLARVVGDGLTIAYLQDILVTPEHQRGGVGRELFRRVFEPFDDVRQKLLITDDEPRQLAFYESMGFTEIRELQHPTRAFAKFD